MGNGDRSIASWSYSLPDESLTLINVTFIRYVCTSVRFIHTLINVTFIRLWAQLLSDLERINIESLSLQHVRLLLTLVHHEVGRPEANGK
jgi:hypothetical protein